MQKIINFLKDRRQLGAWAGMIGSVIFAAIFTLEGCLRPGYNPLGMFVSELSLGPRGWIQIVNFIVFGALVFSLSPVSCFVFFHLFRKDTKWRSLQWWTLTAGVIIAVSVVLMKVGQAQLLEVPNVLGEWIGVIQRAALITYLSWIFTFALGLFRRSKHFEFITKASLYFHLMRITL
jgi:hypothetical protein